MRTGRRFASFIGASNVAERPADTSIAPHPAPSPRTAVRRHAERGHYDAATIDPILDEGLVCHVGVVDSRGPVVTPLAYARVGTDLYLHGAAGNALLAAAASGASICVTVTLVDGLVLARSAFHHSMNYRSVVIFGHAAEVTEVEEKRRALEAIVEHLVPGRDANVRPPNDRELRQTRLVRVPLAEASAKIRTGGPLEEPEDLDRDAWAGEIPLGLVAGVPVPDVQGALPVVVPAHVAEYSRTHRSGARAARDDEV
jgi:uncharacterized protein